jgi:tRNA 2-thiouridine synthesizing protein A
MRPLGRRPGIQHYALFWIPGSLALLAPRNDGFRMDARVKPAHDTTTACPVDDANPLRHLRVMVQTKLDLTGLKCPLPALKTRKALKSLNPGDRLEVHCTDPLSVIDIPNLIRETGDRVEITERAERRIVFLIEKANGLLAADLPS